MDFKIAMLKQRKTKQSGQALVEYAILLILMVTLIMGGLELSVTAYNSKKTGDAAEAGANAWAEAIGYSTKSNANNLDNQNLLELNRENLGIDTNTNLANRDQNGVLITVASCDVLPGDTCPSDNLATAVRPLLDAHCNFNDQYGNFDANLDLPIDVTGCDTTNERQTQGLVDLLSFLNYSTEYPSNPQQDFSEICTSSDNNENIEKVITCRLGVNKYGVRGVVDIYDSQTVPQVACISGSPPCPDGIDDDGNLNITDIYNQDDNDNPNSNGSEGGATQTSCATGPSPCPDGVIDRQGIKLQDLFSLRGDTNGDGIVDNNTDTYDTNAFGQIGNGNENALNQTFCDDGSLSCPDGVADVRGAKVSNGLIDAADAIIDDVDPTFRRLLIRNNLTANSTSVPIQNGVATRMSLGNHNPTNFVIPSCNPLGASASANDYDNGLPDATSIYLFNPLPIDISNCNGTDPFRQNRSRMSILMGGYNDPTPNAITDAPNNPAGDQSVEGLPSVNQAVSSEYIKVCVVENAGQISIARNGSAVVGLDNCTGNGRAIWLKPPGKMCGAAGGSEVCPDGNGIALNLRGATGFYFFGRTHDAVSGSLTSAAAIFNTFRPAFQIVCNGGNLQNANTDAMGSCLANGTGSFALEVHTRYRSIFESFLTFGFNRLANANLAQYFYNPNGVGTSGALVGAAGSELGPVESIANPIPSLKKIKDFRGCYRVDISPPDKIGEQVKTAVSSCN